eukprot:TRINITY_DN6692_c1_g1_i1.p1 TRINITY_DN6692_c1_g1~~TRINITY_DN6692_c1_g1_i1.p1  ORF type:complete len:121 (-),score=3.32 TRINITY_DN6692_c1_g1_i1:264-626(-)
MQRRGDALSSMMGIHGIEHGIVNVDVRDRHDIREGLHGYDGYDTVNTHGGYERYDLFNDSQHVLLVLLDGTHEGYDVYGGFVMHGGYYMRDWCGSCLQGSVLPQGASQLNYNPMTMVSVQ